MYDLKECAHRCPYNEPHAECMHSRKSSVGCGPCCAHVGRGRGGGLAGDSRPTRDRGPTGFPTNNLPHPTNASPMSAAPPTNTSPPTRYTPPRSALPRPGEILPIERRPDTSSCRPTISSLSITALPSSCPLTSSSSPCSCPPSTSSSPTCSYPPPTSSSPPSSLDY